MDGSLEPTGPVQRNRRMTPDWFRVPPTDYLNVSSVTYPRGSRATVAELENDVLVEVLFYRNNGRQSCRNGKQSDDWIVQLFVDTDDGSDATVESTKYAAISVVSKPLLDALRPALTSVHCPLSDSVTEEHTFLPPFNDLFFAQGRILETLKHAGLGAAKEKQLRTFVAVMQAVLKKRNHQLRELAGKRIVDYDNVWTLFPPGSFVVTDIHETPHILQVIYNPAKSILPDLKNEEKHMPFTFISYGFDGYNFGMYEDKWRALDWKSHIGVSSLMYRPLAYYERFDDATVVKKAVETGRKSLEYQSYHYCSYQGLCPPTTSRKFLGKVKIDGRVIVDCLQARRSDPEFGVFFAHLEYPISPLPGRTKEIYDTVRPLYLASSRDRRPNREEQEKRKHFFGSHEEYLMLMKPLLPAWSLDHQDWFLVNASLLEPVTFQENPMDRLVDSSSRQLDGAETTKRMKQRDLLMIMLSGHSGTGKTATVVATAELQRRSILRLEFPDADTKVANMRWEFLQTLDNAAAWQAFILVDDAVRVFESSDVPNLFTARSHLAHDIANMLERFSGVVFLAKQDDQHLIDELTKQVQVHLQLGKFSAEKRQKIWTARFTESSFPVSKETIKDISAWELNGHQIEHLFESLQLVYPSGQDRVVSIAEIEEIKSLMYIAEEGSRCRESGNALVSREGCRAPLPNDSVVKRDW